MYKYVLLVTAMAPFFILAESATVVRVVDGDTVIVNINNNEERIRILGIDTPEIVASNRPVECFGKEASDYAKELLSPGDPIILSKSNIGDSRDKYQRLLRYIETNDQDFGQIMINNGYAYAYRTFDHDRKSKYVSAEKIAQTNKQGLWAEDACRYAEQSSDVIVSTWQNYFITLNKILRFIVTIW